MPKQGRKGKPLWITDELKQRAVDLLVRRQRRRSSDNLRLINDIAFGRILGLAGKDRESIKRRSRELRKALVEDGVPIVCIHSAKGGAYIAEDAAEHRLYRQAVEAEGKRKLARAASLKRSRAAADAGGQFSMFDLSGGGPTHRF